MSHLTGSVVTKLPPNCAVIAGVGGTVDFLTRGLAVDLAPIRVNVISPGIVDTEVWVGLLSAILHLCDADLVMSGRRQLWYTMPAEPREQILVTAGERLLIKNVRTPTEIAEAYLFVI